MCWFCCAANPGRRAKQHAAGIGGSPRTRRGSSADGAGKLGRSRAGHILAQCELRAEAIGVTIRPSEVAPERPRHSRPCKALSVAESSTLLRAEPTVLVDSRKAPGQSPRSGVARDQYSSPKCGPEVHLPARNTDRAGGRNPQGQEQTGHHTQVRWPMLRDAWGPNSKGALVMPIAEWRATA